MDEAFVDQVYEAAAVPERWGDVLRSLTVAADAKGAVLAAARGTDFQRWIVSSPDFAELVELHVRDYAVNERTRRLVSARHAGFLRDHDDLEQAEIDREPVYQELLIPRGYGSGIATAISAPSGDTFILHAERSHEDGPFSSNVVRRFDALRPHLARAALFAARLEMERAVSVTAALGVIGLPAAVLGAQGRMLAANDRLQGMMPSVMQDRRARVALLDAAADTILANTLSGLDQSRAQTVQSIPIKATEGNPPIIVHILPIRGAAHDVFARATALVIVTPIEPAGVPDADLVQGLFDLTPAQSKIAALIAAGRSPREAASHLGVTAFTARTHLKRVLAKTGTHRQADLVRLLRFKS